VFSMMQRECGGSPPGSKGGSSDVVHGRGFGHLPPTCHWNSRGVMVCVGHFIIFSGESFLVIMLSLGLASPPPFFLI
jgi:hypothetical protein